MQRTTMKHFSDLIKHTLSVLSEWNASFDFEIGFKYFLSNISRRYQDNFD